MSLQNHSSNWNKLTPPLRPTMEVARTMYRVTPRGRTLLLGVTPEFHSVFEDIHAVDFNPSMIEHVWPGDTLIKRAHLADWRTMEFEDSYFDAIIGDGALGLLGSAYAIQQFQARALRWLKPGGVFAHRVFERPTPALTLDDLRADLSDTDLCWNAFKMKLLFYMAEQNNGVAKFTEVLELFDELVKDRDLTPWARAQVDTIDLYAGLDATTVMPNRWQHALLTPDNIMECQFIPTEGYDLAECCPIMIWKRAR